MDELISKAKVLKLINDKYINDSRVPKKFSVRWLRKLVELMVPEIIYCKDCKHCIHEGYDEYTPYGSCKMYYDFFCDKHFDKDKGEYLSVNIDDYCSFAERKED